MTLQKTIHNALTGEVITRDYTAAEILEHETNMAQHAANLAQHAATLAAKQTARQAVLDKLGLTADEATALLG